MITHGAASPGLFAAIVRVLVLAVDAAEVIERWESEAGAEDSGPQLADDAALEPLRAKLHPGTGTPMQAVEHPADGTWSPQIGDRVHYVAHGTPIRHDGSQAFPAACRAAVVTEVLPVHRVGLFVMNRPAVSSTKLTATLASSWASRRSCATASRTAAAPGAGQPQVPDANGSAAAADVRHSCRPRRTMQLLHAPDERHAQDDQASVAVRRAGLPGV